MPRFWTAIIAASGLTLLAFGQSPTLAPAPILTASLQRSVAEVQAAMAAFDPSELHIPKAERQALAEGQVSVSRNLTEAAPGLLSAFAAAPNDLGAAFRLYRDLEAVLLVAERSRDALPTGSNVDNPPLVDAVAGLHDTVAKLGDWIQARGSADYQAAQQARAQNGAPNPAAPAAPPATLVIGDANSSPSAAKAKPKPKPAPTIPH